MALQDYWFPFTPSKWKRDTVDLTPAQDGVYLRLVMYYMETKLGLPDSPASLARIAGISPDDFAPIWEVIHRFFHRGDDGRHHHEKCDEILKSQMLASAKHKKRAKKAANARWRKGLEKQGQISFEDAISNHDAHAKNARGEEMRGEERIREEIPSPSNPSDLSKNPIPPNPPAATPAPAVTALGNGFKKIGGGSGMGGEGNGTPFSLTNWLAGNPDAEERIMRELLTVAPGRDRKWLVAEYDATASKRKGHPHNPEQAFLGWVKQFYGKRG